MNLILLIYKNEDNLCNRSSHIPRNIYNVEFIRTFQPSQIPTLTSINSIFRRVISRIFTTESHKDVTLYVIGAIKTRKCMYTDVSMRSVAKFYLCMARKMKKIFKRVYSWFKECVVRNDCVYVHECMNVFIIWWYRFKKPCL